MIKLGEVLEYSQEVMPVIGSFSIGELFIESATSNMISINMGQISNYSSNTEGFGLRVVDGITQHFYSSTNLSLESIINKCGKLRGSFPRLKSNDINVNGLIERKDLYKGPHIWEDSIYITNFVKKIDSYIRKDSIVQNTHIKVITTNQDVWICNNLGRLIYDNRPMWRVIMIAMVGNGVNKETVSIVCSSRGSFNYIKDNWGKYADDLLRKAHIVLKGESFIGGTMPVVFGNGMPAVLLHEAIGHGMEGDFNRKGTSAFAGKLGQRVSSEDVIICDDGTMPYSRGSIHFDDEGTPTQCTTLVQNGILTKYICDRLNGELLGIGSTGNGRRQSFAHLPMPRMTNTYMKAGNVSLDDMISSINKGVYVLDLPHGQVDITSGQFSFASAEIYAIENGKITYPIKGCNISGMGFEALANIKAVGGNFKMDTCGGSCGKNGQLVPVGIGQPEVLVDNLTVGGM